MATFTASESFAHGQAAKTVILLVQLGTPDEPTAPALKRYLKEFLSDPRVVEIPALVWQIILRGIILNIRPKKSAAKYASVWMKDGSPLRVHTQRQTKLLRGFLGEAGHNVEVVHAMRYGNPSVAAVLRGLREKGLERILVIPMYPQYAAATTATAFDAVFAEFSRWRNQPELRTIKHFHDHPDYINALASRVEANWSAMGGRPAHFLMSFHGVPKRSLLQGDPYHCECLKTGRLLAARLGLNADQFSVSFQSRFGKAEWLQPYTTATLVKLGAVVKGRLDVFCPGFVADCLETLEEIAIEGKEDFIAAGGQDYQYIPCVNDSPDFIKALGLIAINHLGGWNTEIPTNSQLLATKRELDTQRETALALGSEK